MTLSPTETRTAQISVLIAEADPGEREALGDLCAREPTLRLVGIATPATRPSPSAAREAGRRAAGRADARRRRLRAVTELSRRSPATRVIVLSASPSTTP